MSLTDTSNDFSKLQISTMIFYFFQKKKNNDLLLLEHVPDPLHVAVFFFPSENQEINQMWIQSSNQQQKNRFSSTCHNVRY